MNILYNGDTVTLSIFPNGTIMFQGKKSVDWVCHNIDKITNEVECDIEDNKLSLDDSESTDESDTSNTSANILGICAICDGKNNNYMIECHKCFSWTHHSCDNLTEKAARKLPKYFCIGCRLKFDALQVQKSSTPLKKTTKFHKHLNSPNLTSIKSSSDQKIYNHHRLRSIIITD